MNIYQLPSGNWRIRKYYKGKNYSVIVDKKPTQAEAELLISNAIGMSLSTSDKASMPFDTACKLYVDSNQSRLSPSTVRDYKLIPGRMPKWFLEKHIDDITQNDISQYVNERLRDGRSPKTIRNEHGFIVTVLHEFRPDFTITTKLPRPRKKTKEELYIPTKEEVARIIEYSKDTNYWCALELAKLGLRRGEICAVDASKIRFHSEAYILSIDDDLVKNEANQYVLHGDTKTLDSRRELPIPKSVAEYILDHGKAYEGHPDMINRYLQTTQKKLGIPKFNLHKMRYYFATQLDQAGVPRADSHRLGGWSLSSDVYERVYRQDEIDRDLEKKKKTLDSIFGSDFSE